MSTEDLSKLKIQRELTPQTTGRRRRRLIQIAAVAGISLVLIVIVLLQPRALEVQTTAVVTSFPSQQFVLLNATGYVVAQRKAAVASKATGRLEWLGVAEGSRVKANEIIARLDSRDVQAQYDNASANVKVAKAAIEQAQAEAREADLVLKRAQDLLSKAFITQANVDAALARSQRAAAGVSSAKAGLAAAEAAQRVAQVTLDFTLIRAPFDGVILSKSANVGDIVTPFSSAADSKGAVVNMADMSTLEVEADVSEASLAKVKVGQACEIILDALPDTRFRGTISRMVPTVDRAKATVMTKVKFNELDSRILPEMSAKVSFLTQEVTAEQQKPLITVHADALTERAGKTVVYLIIEDKAKEIQVTKGTKLGEQIAVLGSLKPGDKVVLKPDPSLRDGMAVKVAQKS